MRRASLPFPHQRPQTEPGPRLAADEGFHGHLTDTSRSRRVGTHRIAPGSPASESTAAVK